MKFECRAKGLEKSFRLSTNEAASCCKSYTEKFDQNLPELLQLWEQESEQMRQGITVPSCEQCWRDEATGKTSLRQTLNNHPNLENKIDIYVSNLCNHMCSYCSPKFSSEWQKSVTKDGVFDLISKTTQNNQTLEKSNFATQLEIDQNLEQINQYIKTQPDHSVVLSLLGGEPLMQHQGLKKILDFDQTKIKRLVIVSNLNPPSPKFLHKFLNTIDVKKLLIHISIDTAPEYNHLPRHGFDKNRFDANFDYIKSLGVEHTVISVTSLLSAFTLDKFKSWCDKNSITPTFQGLQNPSCLEISQLPVNIKQQILQSIDSNFLDSNLLWQLESAEPSKVKQYEQYNYCRQYFQRTGIKQETMPLMMQQWWTELSKKFG